MSAAVSALPIPGSLPSVSRLYGGLDESHPERFVPNLLQVLLDRTSPGDNWDLVEARVALVDYLDDLASLRKEFGSTIVVAQEPKELRKRFDKLCEGLGYDVSFKKGSFRIVGKEGSGDARRRKLALALGWNFEEIAGRLAKGERVTLEIRDDSAPSPFPLELWGSITGKPIAPAEALERLAKDQRLTFVLAGLLRQDEATVDALAKSGVLNTIYRDHAAPFFRYSHAIRIDGGAVVPPGGSAKLWEELVGESARNPARFVPDLLGKKGGRLAFLWESLWSAPPDAAAFYLGSESGGDRQYLKRVLAKLDNSTEEDFSAPAGSRFGFGAFVRSVPIKADGSGLDLPGGPGLWWVAVKGEDAPDSGEALARIARRGLETTLDDGELILRILGETVHVGGFARPALPRLVRAANLFPNRRELLTPEVVVLATRMVDTAPAALDVLDSLPLAKAESGRAYLLAVTNLLDLPRQPEAERFAVTFQAGVETLRALAAAHKLPDAAIETLFDSWSALHQEGHDPVAATPGWLAWLRQLAAALQAADPVANGPGRAPAERALLAALTPARDPQQFELDGVPYRGERGLAMRTSWARVLLEQGVPALDDLLALGDELEKLAKLCAEEQLEPAQTTAKRALALLDRLPVVDLKAAQGDRKLAERVLPVERPSIRAVLVEIGAVRKASRLDGLERDVRRAIGALGGEVRVVLLAPAYLRSIGGSDSALLAAPGLVRGHLLFRSLELATETDNGWSATELVRGGGEALGAHVVGPVSGVSRAIAEAGLAALGGGAGGGAANPMLAPRLRLGFEDLALTEWNELTPAVLGAVAAAVDAGDAVVELFRAVGPALASLPEALRASAAVVPQVRLAPGSRAAVAPPVAPSERLELGLALIALPKGSQLGAVGRQRDRLVQALDVLGPGWRELMAQAGVPMPSATGRSRPWIESWPSFESLDHESGGAALLDRERLELKLAILHRAGRLGLAGEVSGALFALALADPERPAPQTSNDWEETVRWTTAVDETRVRGYLRALLEAGHYSLSGF